MDVSAYRRRLPRWLVDLLRAVPTRGEKLNNWLFRVARCLWAFRARDEIVELLYAATDGEPVRPGEIERAKSCAYVPGQRSYHVAHAWPKLNAEERASVIATGRGFADLRERSPVLIKDDQPRTEEIVDHLFPENPLLCCGRTQFSFVTQNREEWRGKLSALQFIVPNPMIARSGLTKKGDESAHALSITGPRKYLVIEQDAGTIDEQSAVLLHLSAHAPLVLVIHSGSKSIHGWFACFNGCEPIIRQFMKYAVSLGADDQLWSPSQFVRMPDGRRENGSRQTVFYFNPANLH